MANPMLDVCKEALAAGDRELAKMIHATALDEVMVGNSGHATLIRRDGTRINLQAGESFLSKATTLRRAIRKSGRPAVSSRVPPAAQSRASATSTAPGRYDLLPDLQRVTQAVLKSGDLNFLRSEVGRVLQRIDHRAGNLSAGERRAFDQFRAAIRTRARAERLANESLEDYFARTEEYLPETNGIDPGWQGEPGSL